jgi:methylenetetrahydrofolate reductase (NADPH)
MSVIRDHSKTAFSFEILPPLKGNHFSRVCAIIDKLREFDPQYINITTHHSEYFYREVSGGGLERVRIRKRPGTVAIAGAIRNRYGIPTVPHIICTGFTREETEYALIDLQYLGVTDLLLLRGDAGKGDVGIDAALCHDHALDLIGQVNRFNAGFDLLGNAFERPETPFSYGVACYPEKHEEAPNAESDLFFLKQKADAGAEYAVTQMFFDNAKYFNFVARCRGAGITIPIIPGIKPIVFKDQLSLLPKIFRSEIPETLAAELRKCATDEEAREVGVEWSIRQCRELIRAGVPSLHFYTLMATDSVRRIAQAIY